jgi:hypothetical protein
MQSYCQSEFPFSRIFISNLSTSLSEVKLFFPSPDTQTILSGEKALCLLSVYFSKINDPFLIFNLNQDKLRKVPTPVLVFQSKSRAPNLSKPFILGQVSKTILIKKHFNRLPFYLIAVFLSTLTLAQLVKLFRDGHISLELFLQFLNKIREKIWQYYYLLKLFLFKLFHKVHGKKIIELLPEKTSIIKDNSSYLIDYVIDVLDGVEVQSLESCRKFIFSMLDYGNLGVLETHKYTYGLKVLRGLRRLFRQYELNPEKAHLLSELEKKISFSENYVKNSGELFRKLAKVFKEKTTVYTKCLHEHSQLEEVDDLVFDKIQELFEKFIEFSLRYKINLDE